MKLDTQRKNQQQQQHPAREKEVLCVLSDFAFDSSQSMQAFIQFLSIKLPSLSLLRAKVFYWLKLVFMLFFLKSKARKAASPCVSSYYYYNLGQLKSKRCETISWKTTRGTIWKEKNRVHDIKRSKMLFLLIRLLLCNFLTSALQLRQKRFRIDDRKLQHLIDYICSVADFLFRNRKHFEENSRFLRRSATELDYAFWKWVLCFSHSVFSSISRSPFVVVQCGRWTKSTMDR